MLHDSAGLRRAGVGAGACPAAAPRTAFRVRTLRVVLLVLAGLGTLPAAAQSGNQTTVSISASGPATFAREGQMLTFTARLWTGNTPIERLTFSSGSPTGMSAPDCPGLPADLLTDVVCTMTYTTTAMDMAMRNIPVLGRFVATRPGGATRSGSTNTLNVAYAPPRAPDAPTAVVATVGNGQASVAFQAPAFDGGYPVSGYVVTSSPGGITATGSTSPIVVNGLVNGQSYRFAVEAMNRIGTGAGSGMSTAVTPVAPQTITFANPGARDFGTVPELVATASSGLPVAFASTTPGVCLVSNATLTFLAAGVCTVTASQAGNAAFSAAAPVSRSFAVNAVVPGAPFMEGAMVDGVQATVRFVAPASSGGAAVTGYTVTSSPGGFTATGTASPLTVTGLTAGTLYTFTVTARNAAGTSSASAVSNDVRPRLAQLIHFAHPGTQSYGSAPTLGATADSGLAVTFSSGTPGVCAVAMGGRLTFAAAGVCIIHADQAGDDVHLPATRVTRQFTVVPAPPGAPTSITAVAGNGEATVSFSAPAETGGSAITGYVVHARPGNLSASGTTSPLTVRGLTNGTPYTFTVSALNDMGEGVESNASAPVTPAPPLAALPGTASVAYGAAATPLSLPISGSVTSVAVETGPAHGSARVSGATITYAPAPGYAGPDSFTFTASDGTTTTAPARMTITVEAPVVTLASVAPASATGGAAYSHSFGASGGAAPYVFSLVAGALPEGLALQPDGTLSGVPTRAGRNVFTIQARDSSTGTGPFTAQQAYTLEVAAPTIVLDLALPGFGFGDRVEETLQATGGVAPYTYSLASGALPDGLSLSAAGVLSGTVARAGRYSGSVEVSDANGFMARGRFEFVAGLASQAITAFAATPVQPVFAPGATFAVAAQGGGSGQPVRFASTTPTVCTVEGTRVALHAAGRCSLTADQAGDDNHAAAVQLTLDVDITAAVPDLDWPAQISKVLGEEAFDLDDPQSNSAGTFSFASSQPAVASVSGRTVTLHGAGTAVITATQAASGEFVAASVEMQLVVVERPDPTRDPGVTGLLQAQVDASVRFASAQQSNIRDRLRQVRTGSNASSNNLSVTQAGGAGRPGVTLPLTQSAAPAWPALPDGWGTWLAGSATFGRSGHAGGFDIATDGITFGVDRAVGAHALMGIAGSLATNASELDDRVSRMDADQRSLALYGLWRTGEHVFVDGMLGRGHLDFDIRRHSADADATGTAARDGRQWFASVSMGYAHDGPAMTWTGYGRLETTRATLDAYRESGLGLHDLAYGRQVVENSTAAVGLEGTWRPGDGAGPIRPFWSAEYRQALSNEGEAVMHYVLGPGAVDYRLQMGSYNDHALSLGAGFDVRLQRGWLLTLLLGHEQARNATQASSIGLRVSYGAQSLAPRLVQEDAAADSR